MAWQGGEWPSIISNKYKDSINAFHLKLQLQLHTTAYRCVPVTTHTQKKGGREGSLAGGHSSWCSVG